MRYSPHRILIIDDEAPVLDALARALHGHYDIVTCSDPAGVTDLVLREGPFSVVLCDYDMPYRNGAEVLAHLARLSPDTSRIMLTGKLHLEVAVEAINDGRVFRFLTKPCPRERLLSALEAGVEQYQLVTNERDLRQHLERRVSEQVREIQSAHEATIFAMSSLAESRDPETGGHLHRIQNYCLTVASRMLAVDPNGALTPALVQHIRAASPLHDIGKVGVPDSVLLKPGRLTPAEQAIMERHTVIGADTLRVVERTHPGNVFVRVGIEIAESHHERWDGQGYPHRLAGTDIPLAARVLALADVYDALVSERCYKSAWDHERSAEFIVAARGRHLDPDVVDAFVTVEDRFRDIADEYRGQ